MYELTEAMVKTIKAAAKKMTGGNRRAFEAEAALDYLGGDSRLAETVFGWSRKTVRKGLEEFRRGSVISDLPRNFVRKTEEKNPQLAQDIRDLVEPQSQADPNRFPNKMANHLCLHTHDRPNGPAGIDRAKGHCPEDLPSEGTVGVMLGRMGYRTPLNQ